MTENGGVRISKSTIGLFGLMVMVAASITSVALFVAPRSSVDALTAKVQEQNVAQAANRQVLAEIVAVLATKDGVAIPMPPPPADPPGDPPGDPPQAQVQIDGKIKVPPITAKSLARAVDYAKAHRLNAVPVWFIEQNHLTPLQAGDPPETFLLGDDGKAYSLDAVIAAIIIRERRY